MTTDPTNLDVRVPDAAFMDNYDTGGDFVPPPQAKTIVNGKPKFTVFQLAAPSLSGIKLRDENGKFLKTKDGWLKAVIEGITVVDGGYKIGQTHIGTGQYKKYDRQSKQPTGEFRNASPALDYLHAHGIEVKPETADAYEELFNATADRHFEATLDWSAYDKDTQSDVASKWDDFPDDPAAPGTKLPFIEKNGKRFWARAQVKRYVSQVPDAKK